MPPWVKRLNDALQRSGWSKSELARRSGVNYDSLNKYLAGKVEHPRGDSRISAKPGTTCITTRT